ncbi:hypothetical protein [Helicovermis profundi]|uniref:Uncharacterized protein n=1 Tax=Helicovermis profundi TaxID=3065157 RepID=A0AAU9ECE3_9FIRM|nr:hypothetical protein HLPR_19530 [Clostridia bacterium S502]
MKVLFFDSNKDKLNMLLKESSKRKITYFLLGVSEKDELVKFFRKYIIDVVVAKKEIYDFLITNDTINNLEELIFIEITSKTLAGNCIYKYDSCEKILNKIMYNIDNNSITKILNITSNNYYSCDHFANFICKSLGAKKLKILQIDLQYLSEASKKCNWDEITNSILNLSSNEKIDVSFFLSENNFLLYRPFNNEIDISDSINNLLIILEKLKNSANFDYIILNNGLRISDLLYSLIEKSNISLILDYKRNYREQRYLEELKKNKTFKKHIFISNYIDLDSICENSMEKIVHEAILSIR